MKVSASSTERDPSFSCFIDQVYNTPKLGGAGRYPAQFNDA
jgi:hypothetical protein